MSDRRRHRAAAAAESLPVAAPAFMLRIGGGGPASLTRVSPRRVAPADHHAECAAEALAGMDLEGMARRVEALIAEDGYTISFRNAVLGVMPEAARERVEDLIRVDVSPEDELYHADDRAAALSWKAAAHALARLLAARRFGSTGTVQRDAEAWHATQEWLDATLWHGFRGFDRDLKSLRLAHARLLSVHVFRLALPPARGWALHEAAYALLPELARACDDARGYHDAWLALGGKLLGYMADTRLDLTFAGIEIRDGRRAEVTLSRTEFDERYSSERTLIRLDVRASILEVRGPWPLGRTTLTAVRIVPCLPVGAVTAIADHSGGRPNAAMEAPEAAPSSGPDDRPARPVGRNTPFDVEVVRALLKEAREKPSFRRAVSKARVLAATWPSPDDGRAAVAATEKTIGERICNTFEDVHLAMALQKRLHLPGASLESLLEELVPRMKTGSRSGPGQEKRLLRIRDLWFGPTKSGTTEAGSDGDP